MNGEIQLVLRVSPAWAPLLAILIHNLLRRVESSELSRRQGLPVPTPEIMSAVDLAFAALLFDFWAVAWTQREAGHAAFNANTIAEYGISEGQLLALLIQIHLVIALVGAMLWGVPRSYGWFKRLAMRSSAWGLSTFAISFCFLLLI